ncbi:outer membrane protein [Gemmatimonas phototrophica]|uniref:Outer membrane protein beta-barrel domain-containing protein n=1 Tax=Gemmatimonas phototrophica TaxID=1379270 RepID=A0A143BHD9_9BACT|nr:hypothetical protein [Gemmatimonas phototrophica]AMW04448.1 hypothetical protein GEMMAAP_05525 [Gemmatimonas phototrophica]
MHQSRLSRHARSTLRACLLSTLALLPATPLFAQQVGVSAVPSAQRIQWDADFPLEDGYLYGGRLALRFGKWVELQPFYFLQNKAKPDATRGGALFGPRSLGKSLDLQHYGTSIQFNLSDAAVVPFARLGAGVLRLEPDSAPRQDRIAVSAGGGVRFGFAGLNAEVYAEQMGFRMRPNTLFGPDTTSTENLKTLRNVVYGAAVTIPLSTMRSDEGNDGGLSGSTAPLELFVGQLRYAGAHRLPDLEVAGVRAGIDFSPVFGIRGFYWRGVNDDRDGPAPVAGFGGEAQFNLSTGAGLSPYLITGAGQIDYKDTFADSLGGKRVDKTAFIVGGGASFRLTDRLRINGAIRDYIMTVDEDLDAVASTSDLTHNTMLTAGLTISFGGRSTPSAQQQDRERSIKMRGMRASPDSLRMRSDSSRRLMQPQIQRGATPSSQWITIPVPTQGEVILRYGWPPRTMGSDSVLVQRMDGMLMRRDSVMSPSNTPPAIAPAGDLSAELREMERRLSTRIDALQRAALIPPPPQTVTVIAPPSAQEVVTLDRDAAPVFQRLQRTRTSDLRPYAGLGFDDGDVQFVVGTRADLGPIRPNSGFRFVPELAVGFGGDNLSVLALANVQYTFGSFGGTRTIHPYATVGAGIFSPTVLGVNTAVGSSFSLRPATETPLYLNMELQGINLFNQTRVLVGLSRNR